jgi:TonB-dependent Receptor Plug Domain
VAKAVGRRLPKLPDLFWNKLPLRFGFNHDTVCSCRGQSRMRGVAHWSNRNVAGAAGAASVQAALLAVAMAPVAAVAQQNATPGTDSNAVPLPEIRVIATTPIAPPRRTPTAPVPSAAAAAPVAQTATAAEPGVVDLDKIPQNVQTIPASDFAPTKAPDLLQAMARALPGVALSDQTGNQFQLDLNYRGFIASPVIGTPQGLAVYQNGVRINEVFGDIVNWDFIPQSAINRMTLVPSNPVYGLNAIGGALSLEMKNGFSYHGVEGDVTGGSFGRIGATAQAGGQKGSFSGYITADAIDDAGWRQESPSQLRRVFADLGARGDNNTEFHVTFTGADNHFGAIAATPVQMLAQNWASVFYHSANDREPTRVPDGERKLAAHQYVDLPGDCLLSLFPPSPRRRQRHERIERSRGMSRSHIAVLSQSQRDDLQSHDDHRTDGREFRRARFSECLGRNRPHLDDHQQLRRLGTGCDIGKAVRP